MAARGLERRVKLQLYLEDILRRLDKLITNKSGITNVYFRPSPTVNIVYPCLIYDRSNASIDYADNKPYKIQERYTITCIDEDPDSEIVTELETLPMCTFDRSFSKDGLHHDIFTLYF